MENDSINTLEEKNAALKDKVLSDDDLMEVSGGFGLPSARIVQKLMNTAKQDDNSLAQSSVLSSLIK